MTEGSKSRAIAEMASKPIPMTVPDLASSASHQIHPATLSAPAVDPQPLPLMAAAAAVAVAAACPVAGAAAVAAVAAAAAVAPAARGSRSRPLFA